LPFIMSFAPINPRPFLSGLVGKEIKVRLKWGNTSYAGTLVSVDSYMNFQLSGAEEYIDDKMTGQLGQILIRCNNVLWVSEAGETDEDRKGGDVEMDG